MASNWSDVVMMLVRCLCFLWESAKLWVKEAVCAFITCTSDALGPVNQPPPAPVWVFHEVSISQWVASECFSCLLLKPQLWTAAVAAVSMFACLSQCNGKENTLQTHRKSTSLDQYLVESAEVEEEEEMLLAALLLSFLYSSSGVHYRSTALQTPLVKWCHHHLD